MIICDPCEFGGSWVCSYHKATLLALFTPKPVRCQASSFRLVVLSLADKARSIVFHQISLLSSSFHVNTSSVSVCLRRGASSAPHVSLLFLFHPFLSDTFLPVALVKNLGDIILTSTSYGHPLLSDRKQLSYLSPCLYPYSLISGVYQLQLAVSYHIVLAWAAVTKYHALAVLNSRNLLSLSSGGYESKVRVPACSSSGEEHLHALQTDAFSCVFTWQKER